MAIHPSASSTPTWLWSATGHAHAKAILLGEHSVVHGSAAIALPVPELGVEVEAQAANGPGTIESGLYRGALDAAPARLRPTVTAAQSVLRRHGREDLDIHLRIRSDVPPERGLGSSAAVAAATIGAVLQLLGDDASDPAVRHELIQDAERVAHGTPSGLDARTVVSEWPLWYRRDRFERTEVRGSFVFVLADTGAPSRTRDAVEAVHAQRREKPLRVARIVELLGELANGAREDLAAGDRAALGARMDDAHTLLQQLQVSSAELDHLVRAARTAGAAGAKLTGGGLGGCVIALAEDADDAGRLAESLRRAGAAAVWITTPRSVS